MNKVLVVSAYIPLPVRHLTEAQYRTLGARLAGAVEPYPFVVYEHPLEECWLYNEPGLPWVPAAPVPLDRYATPEDNVKSHIIQHNRTEWALRATHAHPDADVIVWFDYGLMKQGAWRGNPIQTEHVLQFLGRVAAYPFRHSMPFPGIEGPKPVDPHGNNWRFCGSTHIWPVKWLAAIHKVYKESLRDFIARYDRVPLDLAIWPEVEKRCADCFGPNVPFQWYRAEYDASQLTNFPDKELP